MFTFGLNPPKSVTMSWGARAIFQNGIVDLVHNRQTWRNPSMDGLTEQAKLAIESEAGKMHNFIHSAMNDVREWAKDIAGSSDEMFEFEADGYIIKATPRASYGYLHIGAWKKQEKTCPTT